MSQTGNSDSGYGIPCVRMQQTKLHKVSRVRPLSAGCSVLEVDGPIPQTRAGQFYMLRTENQWPVMLPRPFSLYSRAEDGRNGAFLLKAIGPGTEALVACRAGDRVWITGPLGRSSPADVPNPVCVAGGIGLAPFLLLAEERRDRGDSPPRLVFGGRTVAHLAGMNDFDSLAELHTCTDDGSHGSRGLVTDLMEELLQRGVVKSGETVFCCGPDPMMAAVARLCAANELRCFLSLETYMACGYGVCNGCTVPVQGERFRGWPYSKACIQGPVYEASELRDLKHPPPALRK